MSDKHTPKLSYDGQGVIMADKQKVVCQLAPEYLDLAPFFCAAPETAARRDRLKTINAELVKALRDLIPFCERGCQPAETTLSVIKAKETIVLATTNAGKE